MLGRVVLAGTGQPVDGVRVTINGPELRGSRSVMTNEEGQFAFVGLPAGTFTVRGTRTGYIAGTYGQKQVGKPGTAIVLTDGQELKDLSFEIAKGGVISGIVYDEKNRPSIGTPVRVMRWMMQSGERTLSSVGSGTTDDRGMYRIYNLMPGEYLISAVPRNVGADVTRMEEIVVDGRVVGVQQTSAPDSTEPVEGYAPVFYPGTTQLATARSVRVGISEEQLGLDFPLQRVALTTVMGQVIVPNGQSPTTVQVRMFHSEGNTFGVGQQSTRPSQTGTFTFRNVVPGQYTVFATATVSQPRAPGAGPQNPSAERLEMLTREMEMLQSGDMPGPPGQSSSQRRLWAQSEVVVDGGYPPAVSLTMQEGLALSGQITFNGTAPQPAGNQRVRVAMNPIGQPLQSMGLGSMNATVDAGGRFTINGVVPGRYRISASGASGWQVKSVIANGVDVMDFPLEIAAAPVPAVTVQFGDRSTDLKGTLSDANAAPTADYSVVIFPDDPRYWVPYARRMRSTRPSTDGKFSFAGLPPGDYRLAAVTDIETGEWFDPEFLRQLMPASISVRLVEGQPVTQEIRVR